MAGSFKETHITSILDDADDDAEWKSVDINSPELTTDSEDYNYEECLILFRFFFAVYQKRIYD